MASSTVNKRRMSYFSRIIIDELYPKTVGVPSFNITSLLYFKNLPDLEKLKELLNEKIVPLYKFTSIPHENKADKIWEWKEYVFFNLDNHIIQTEVDDQQGVLKYLDSLVYRQLPPTKPLWCAHLIKNKSGDSALILEVHHAVCDGISLMKLAMKLVTKEDGTFLEFPSTKVPFQKKKGLLAFFIFLWGVIYSILKNLLLPLFPADTKHAMKVPLPYTFSNERKIVFLPVLSLNAVKALKNKTKTTVNDVLTAALAGAFQRYLESQNDPNYTEKMKVRCVMPYSFPVEDDDLHNNWSLVSAALPVGKRYNTAEARLAKVKETMDAIKSRPEPHIGRALQRFVDKYFPKSFVSQLSLDLVTKHSLIFTNVPGFNFPVYICGEMVKQIQPVIANIIPQFSVHTYNGGVYVNFVADEKVVKDVEKFCSSYVEELKSLANEYKIDESITL
ncbi:hypothetical protein HK099_007649 [Clydaea vesicula]|uniref:Diacylglycerol O-acyltransferase n=1 Tax=Clydaea vesicula TaxID=447962 RepID=A0AAD5U5C7_9FUNG|nr:hypothetical protein HK099_007649 [Clydaea vesicula]